MTGPVTDLYPDTDLFSLSVIWLLDVKQGYNSRRGRRIPDRRLRLSVSAHIVLFRATTDPSAAAVSLLRFPRNCRSDVCLDRGD